MEKLDLTLMSRILKRGSKGQNFKFLVAPGGYVLFPAYYVGCDIGNVGMSEDGQ